MIIKGNYLALTQRSSQRQDVGCTKESRKTFLDGVEIPNCGFVVKIALGALGILPKSVRFAYEMERSGMTHMHGHFAAIPRWRL